MKKEKGGGGGGGGDGGVGPGALIHLSAICFFCFILETPFLAKEGNRSICDHSGVETLK